MVLKSGRSVRTDNGTVVRKGLQNTCPIGAWAELDNPISPSDPGGGNSYSAFAIMSDPETQQNFAQLRRSGHLGSAWFARHAWLASIRLSSGSARAQLRSTCSGRHTLNSAGSCSDRPRLASSSLGITVHRVLKDTVEETTRGNSSRKQSRCH